MNLHHNSNLTPGKIYLVGVGPGDPELLTLRALRALRSADAVLHDALVSPEILALASPSAIIENVGKRCGAHRMRQHEIHERMIELASAGLTVVRLQGGDPLLFGRAAEEIAAIARAGLECEIIPGVTAASAAAAAAQISLTDRTSAAQVLFLTGHRAGSLQPEIPPPPPGGATIVTYMPGNSYRELADRFRLAGWPRETPCLVISEASTPSQAIIHATLDTIGDCGPLPAPAIFIAGEVARLREGLPSDNLLTCASVRSSS